MVEVTGLEPAASCSQSRHSSQTELHLDILSATAVFDICKTPKGVTQYKPKMGVIPHISQCLDIL